jgi:hypothetical protein
MDVVEHGAQRLAMKLMLLPQGEQVWRLALFRGGAESAVDCGPELLAQSTSRIELSSADLRCWLNLEMLLLAAYCRSGSLTMCRVGGAITAAQSTTQDNEAFCSLLLIILSAGRTLSISAL